LSFFGLFKTLGGPWEPQTNIFYFVWVVIVVIYLFLCQLWLKTLCTRRRNLIIFIFLPNYADSRAFRPQRPGCYRGPPQNFEPYKSRCPCYLENFFLFWNTSAQGKFKNTCYSASKHRNMCVQTHTHVCTYTLLIA
jgi:hypothetical protein